MEGGFGWSEEQFWTSTLWAFERVAAAREKAAAERTDPKTGRRPLSADERDEILRLNQQMKLKQNRPDLATLDQLIVELRAKTEHLEAGIRRVEGQLGGMSAKAEREGQKVTATFGGMGNSAGALSTRVAALSTAIAGTALAMGAITKAGVEAALRMRDLAHQTGVSTDAVQAFAYVASQTGTSMDTVARSLGFMNKVTGQAVAGNKSAQQSFAQLGLSFRELAELSPEDEFVTLIGRIAELDSAQQRSAALVKIFGRNALEMGALVGQGADGVQKLLDRARELGLILSQGDLDKLAAFADKLDEIKQRAQNLGARGFIELLEKTEELRETVGRLGPTFERLGGVIATVLGNAVDRLATLLNIAATLVNAVALGVQKIAIYDQELLGLISAEDAQTRVAALTKEFTSVQAAATAAGKGARDFGGGLDDLIPSADKAAKNVETLQEKLDEMQKAVRRDLLLSGNGEVEQAVMKAEFAIRDLTDAYGPLDDAMKAQAESIKAGVRELAEYEQAAKAAEKANQELEKAQEEAARKNEELQRQFAQPFENAARNIQNLMTDTFEGLFDGSIDSAADAAKAMKGIFFRLAAELATLALFRPEVFAAGGIGGGLSGIFGGGAAATGGAASSISGASGLIGMGGSLFGGASLSGTWLGGGIDAIGRSLGLSSTVVTANGTVLPGSALSKAFTPAAGLAGLAGGFLSSQLFGGGLGNTIGSTLGGVAGTALGANAGTILGFAGGPAGALIGSLAGGALGSLFGNNKPSDKGQQGFVDLATGSRYNVGGLTGKKFSQENADARDAILGYASELAALLAQETGTALSAQLKVLIGNRDGLRFTLGGGREQNFGKGTDLLSALTAQIADLSKASGLAGEDLANLQTALSKIDFADAAKALADIQFALDFDELGKTPDTITAVEQAIKDLDAQFDAIRETASRLGLSLDRVNAAEKKRLAQMAGDYVKNLNTQLVDALSPGYAQLMGLFENYQTALKEAAALGLSAADTAKITALYQAQVAAATKQTSAALHDQSQSAQQLASRYASVGQRLSDIVFNLRYGQYSPLTPVNNLAALRQMVQDTGAQARLGDVDAQERLAELIPQFIELSGSANGFNAAFEQDRQLAEMLADAAKTVAERQLAIQEQILAQATAQTGLLGQLRPGSPGATGGNANAKLVAAIQGGWRETQPGMIEPIFAANGVFYTGPGSRTAFLDNPANAAVNDRLNAVFHALGIPGFWEGGMVGGRPGMDRNLAWLTRGEGVLNLRAMAGIGEPALNYMNTTGRLPAANDNGRLAAAIDRQTDAIDRQTRVIMATGQVTGEQLAAIRASNAAMRDLTEQQLARA